MMNSQHIDEAIRRNSSLTSRRRARRPIIIFRRLWSTSYAVSRCLATWIRRSFSKCASTWRPRPFMPTTICSKSANPMIQSMWSKRDVFMFTLPMRFTFYLFSLFQNLSLYSAKLMKLKRNYLFNLIGIDLIYIKFKNLNSLFTLYRKAVNI